MTQELILRKKLPDDYHCGCRFCKGSFKGEILMPDKSWPNKFDRNKEYPNLGAVKHKKNGEVSEGHIAKTPLHLARFCVQEFSKEGDWVYDPTMGSGTTGVEALRVKRKAIGCEVDPGHFDIAMSNMEAFGKEGKDFELHNKDARKFSTTKKLALVINNPPYIGDRANHPNTKKDYKYREDVKGQIGLMKEGPDYYDAIMDLYAPAVKALRSGGFFCIGVKDMMRKQEYYLLHYYLTNNAIRRFGLEFHAVYLLRHHPLTGSMRAYQKRFGIWPALYQTITVMKKP